MNKKKYFTYSNSYIKELVLICTLNLGFSTFELVLILSSYSAKLEMN